MATRRGSASSLVEKKRRADERKRLCDELLSTIKVVGEKEYRLYLIIIIIIIILRFKKIT